ncbi:MAG: leucine-rich repeat domain-containing protein [Puniceicoccales bacterium]|jgi:Leucine-rich repeat (LRR) protein|nr:leucine-rich repeat domain-containing protein [Puniceicoccales bacterium]
MLHLIFIFILVNVTCIAFGQGKHSAFKDPQVQRVFSKYASNEPIKLEAIDQLQADNVQISDLSGFEKLTNLQHLSLSKNLISNVHPLVTLKELKELNLSHNLIKVASPLIQLPTLEYLNLANNQIKYCFFCTFPRLQTLNLAHNSIQQIHGQGDDFNKFLTHLDLSSNPLIQFPSKFHAPRLKELNCSETHLNSIASILNLKSLEILRLKNCPNLQTIESLFQETSNGIQCILPNLKELEISENYLNDNSRNLLNKIRQGNLPIHFCLNGQSIEPNQKNVAPQLNMVQF